MEIIKDEIATLNRRRRITVEVDHGEHLMAFKYRSYYRLGGQINDIVGGYCIIDGCRVTWCPITQEWVEA